MKTEINRFCPHCNVELKDISMPKEITEIEQVSVIIGDRKPVFIPLKAKVGKITCPSCGKMIDVFVSEESK